MSKRKFILFLVVITFFLFIVSIALANEKQEDLRLNFITVVYSVTVSEDMPEVNFALYTSIITDDSIPVFLRLSEENKYNTNVSSFDFKYIKDDRHLIRFTLKNLVKNVKNYIAFEVYTLKKVSFYSDMPKIVSVASYFNLSDELKQYTQSSLSVQSAAPEIRAKAYEIFYKSWGGRNVIDMLKEIMHFTGETIEFKAFGSQTALDTLNREYAVCTGKANLAAALCRALGIPARVLSIVPTHFIIEVWIPGYGWVRGEPTKGWFPEGKHIWTVQWILDIEDENRFGPSGGVLYYLGFEDNVGGAFLAEWEDMTQPHRWIEPFSNIESNVSLNEILFLKGTELWRLFCQLKNSGLASEQLTVFSSYHKLYFDSLVNKDIHGALEYADLAIAEAKQLLSL